MTRGEIWWVDLGLPVGSEPGFKRPVLVIQDDAFNQSNINTVIVVAITSNLNLAEAPGNLILSKKDSSLPKESVLNVSQMVTLDRSRFLRKAGKLKQARMTAVDEGLRLVLGLS